MRTYTIKKIEHHVYEDLDELPKDLVYLKDWRKAEIGDWVLADDGCIIQILRKNALTKPRGKVRVVHSVGTCTGTFKVSDKILMDTEKRKDIYTFSGKPPVQKIKDRKKATSNEILFSQLLTRGVSPEDAYLKVYRTDNRKYAKLHAGILVKSERVRKVMKEELKPVLAALGISPELVLEGIKDIATDEDAKHSDKLKALFELGEILELKETNKVTEVTGALFQGFEPKQIEASQRPKLKEA
tara:strand:+ start:1138 stop:1863 length:726 start_codon:yes stop_codon:yes gene_type:complete